MRTSVVPGMLDMLAFNLNRGNSDVHLFEAGNVFELAGSGAQQSKRICLGATGNAIPAGVHQAARALSFFDLKGDIEQILHEFESAKRVLRRARPGVLPSRTFGAGGHGWRDCSSVRPDSS